MNHCSCMFILGLSKFGELYDLAGLIAPRPILFEAGTYIVDSMQVLVALLRKKMGTVRNHLAFPLIVVGQRRSSPNSIFW